jgi:tetratricopeptide (TPR) repeat protein
MHDHAALAGLGALLARTGYRQAASIAYRELTSLYPHDAAARVCLGNVLHQLGQPGAALREYQAALAVEPDLAPAHQGLGDLYAATGRTALARQHWERGYAQHVFNPWPFTGEAAPIRVLLLFSVAGGNLRARTMLDETVFAVTAVAAEFWRPEHGLPPHDLILNAIADADLCAVALRQAARLLAETTAPVINNPDAVARTGRADNAARLAGMPDVAAPRMALVSRDDLAAADGVGVLAAHGLGLPVLLRAPGFHTGQHFTRVSRPDALRDAALDMPDTAVLAIEFLNAAGPDGCFR